MTYLFENMEVTFIFGAPLATSWPCNMLDFLFCFRRL